MREPAPAFQLYARDFEADEKVRLLGLPALGLYMLLLLLCWQEGSIPDDARKVAALTRPDAARHWPAVRELFEPDPNNPGRLRHAQLDVERRKQADRREALSRNGTRGAEKRWHGSAMGSSSPGDSSATATPMALDGLSSSYPSSSPSSKNVASAPPAPPPQVPREIPTDPAELRALAQHCEAAFVRAKTEKTRERRIDDVVDALAKMRSIGFDFRAAWSAFSAASVAHQGRPLHKIVSVLSYLPPRKTAEQIAAHARFRPAREVVRP